MWLPLPCPALVISFIYRRGLFFDFTTSCRCNSEVGVLSERQIQASNRNDIKQAAGPVDQRISPRLC
jgi:hypothetical protein